MKEQGPNPHVPQAVKDLQLAELTEHTEFNKPQKGTGHTVGVLLSRTATGDDPWWKAPTGVRTWFTINTLQVNQSWKKPSVQTRAVARIMEKHTGSALLHSSLSPSPKNRKLLKRILDKERIILSFHKTLVGTYWSWVSQSITINLFQSCPEHISFSPDVWFCFFFLEQRVFLSSVCCNLK